MNFYQERVETDSHVPAKIYIGRTQGSNCHYPLHWHDNLEFDLVLQGTIIGKINGMPIEVPEGEFFFVNSGDLHETDAADRFRMNAITILLSYHLLKEYYQDAHRCYFDFSENEEAREKVKTLILECAQLFENKKEFYELELSIALRKICLILLKDCRKTKQDIGFDMHEQKSIANIKKAITYMENNYMEEVSLKDVSAEIGMTPTYFSKFFKKSTGDNFYDYLIKIRLCHAFMELVNTDHSITEVGLNNGFYNVKSFIEAFKNVYQTTPERYRRQYHSIEYLNNQGV